MQQRRTKIVATLGPATDKPEVLKKMIQAGVNLVRLNFSHGTADDHKKRIEQVREIATELDKEIGILADLQGPKIRITKFKDDKVILEPGKLFILDIDLDDDSGSDKSVGLTYKELIKDIKPNDELLLDDGKIQLKAKKVDKTKIHCEVLVGGALSNNKGINRRGGGLSANALTDKDLKDLKIAEKLDVDYIAISFPRDAKDMEYARSLLAKDSKIGLIAKIERKEAVDNLEEIIEASDAVMVARGDLGVEIGDEKVPSLQKSLIHKARMLDKAVITATQMLESMIESTIPTRAEVSDVANAVLDNTDAVMLSAETASGANPVLAVEAMNRICLETEKMPEAQTSKHRLECYFTRVDEAVTMAAMYTANHLDIKAIIALTESGSTPLWMSRIRTSIPIYALCRHATHRRRMTLYRGVHPVAFDVTRFDRKDLNQSAINKLTHLELIEEKDLVIITKGHHAGQRRTNAMNIVCVGDTC